MTYITVEVDVDADAVLCEIKTEDLHKELELRRKDGTSDTPSGLDRLLTRVYEHFLISGDAPPCLREYLWERLGRVV